MSNEGDSATAMTPEPIDGVPVTDTLWLAWVIHRRTLQVQAWILEPANNAPTSGCACPGCAPHEQPGPPPDVVKTSRCEKTR